MDGVLCVIVPFAALLIGSAAAVIWAFVAAVRDVQDVPDGDGESL
jgi:hypothetical protein